jgi:hypothetical protein
MDYREVLDIATEAVQDLKGQILDLLTIHKPHDFQAAVELAKVISKLSPIVGNNLEYTVAQYLNSKAELWPAGYHWIRQDPDFPDILLSGMPEPRPGIEVKAWFPLATEMTARFRDSQTMLQEGNTKVAVICWLPEYVIAGRPKILDVFLCDALDFATARDAHYHNPPHYLVIEPEDTSQRTRNLQQKNCNGLKFQGSNEQLEEALKAVDSWGSAGKIYRTDSAYQAVLRELTGHFSYRLDTNFAKIDRIALESLEAFKRQMLNTSYFDRTVQDWIKAIASLDAASFAEFLDPTTPLIVE